jgi:hypothetical protein
MRFLLWRQAECPASRPEELAMKALAFAAHQPLPPVRKAAPPPTSGSGVDWLLGSIATVPLAILAVELIVDAVLLVVGVAFAATIFFIFVTFAIFFVAIWLTVGLSALGAFIASVATLAALVVFWQQHRQHRLSTGAVAGLVMSISGLLLHAAAIALAVYCHFALFGQWM